MKKKTVRKLEVLLHLLTALILLIKGYDEISRRLYYPGSIILGLAITVLAITLFWRPLKIKPKQARVMCYYFEAPGLIITSYVLYLEGKESITDIFLIAGLIYPVVGFISSKKFRKLKSPA